VEIENAARVRNVVVAVEYHKRFDDRSLMARKRYRAGMFGEFKLGAASLMEKWYYRHSNFQNWMTVENSDAFTYIGCHYVDLVHFITGLLPASVSVYGLKDRFPNGREGYLWTDARVIWSNGACLNVQNSLGYPEDGPGSNMQHLAMYCSSGDTGAMIRHSDQYRGIEYAYARKPSPLARRCMRSRARTTFSCWTWAKKTRFRWGTATAHRVHPAAVHCV
jgi:predicted dehydrogenase